METEGKRLDSKVNCTCHYFDSEKYYSECHNADTRSTSTVPALGKTKDLTAIWKQLTFE
jgi:hypothetical protein